MIPLRDDNPTSTRPLVTLGLIVACCLVFLWQISLGPSGFERAVFSLGLIPAVLFGSAHLEPGLEVVPAGLTVFSSMFLHGGWMHLIGNMLYLWIFGNNIEDAMGHARFIVFYLLCGVSAALAQAVFEATAQIPMVGASGAISGVLGAYLLLYPHARVQVLVPFGFIMHMMSLPALLVLGFWFLLQLISSAAATAGEGGTAWFAHLGGFVAGMALIPLFKHRGVRFFNPPRRR
ncbi:MAG: rhomboid family intramembrane serine protease [Gammaproteobacteria bacterium]|nr:rhomboid family intramembrane serine protease [Gammaproteobacteria bacterium]